MRSVPPRNRIPTRPSPCSSFGHTDNRYDRQVQDCPKVANITCIRDREFSPTPNRFNVLAELDPSSINGKNLFNFDLASGSATRRRGKRGSRNDKVKLEERRHRRVQKGETTGNSCEKVAAPCHQDELSQAADGVPGPNLPTNASPGASKLCTEPLTHQWLAHFSPSSDFLAPSLSACCSSSPPTAVPQSRWQPPQAAALCLGKADAFAPIDNGVGADCTNARQFPPPTQLHSPPTTERHSTSAKTHQLTPAPQPAIASSLEDALSIAGRAVTAAACNALTAQAARSSRTISTTSHTVTSAGTNTLLSTPLPSSPQPSHAATAGQSSYWVAATPLTPVTTTPSSIASKTLTTSSTLSRRAKPYNNRRSASAERAQEPASPQIEHGTPPSWTTMSTGVSYERASSANQKPSRFRNFFAEMKRHENQDWSWENFRTLGHSYPCSCDSQHALASSATSLLRKRAHGGSDNEDNEDNDAYHAAKLQKARHDSVTADDYADGDFVHLSRDASVTSTVSGYQVDDGFEMIGSPGSILTLPTPPLTPILTPRSASLPSVPRVSGADATAQQPCSAGYPSTAQFQSREQAVEHAAFFIKLRDADALAAASAGPFQASTPSPAILHLRDCVADCTACAICECTGSTAAASTSAVEWPTLQQAMSVKRTRKERSRTKSNEKRPKGQV